MFAGCLLSRPISHIINVSRFDRVIAAWEHLEKNVGFRALSHILSPTLAQKQLLTTA